MQRNVRRVAFLDGFIGRDKQQPAELASLKQSSPGSCLFDIHLQEAQSLAEKRIRLTTCASEATSVEYHLSMGL